MKPSHGLLVSAVGILIFAGSVVAGGWSTGYYVGSNFQLRYSARTDPTINFYFGFESPMFGLGPDYFSARYAARFHAATAGTYQFQTLSDEGVRLWVNSQLIINNWTPHGPSIDTGTVVLPAGPAHIVLEHYEGEGSAQLQLKYRPPGSATFELIPHAAVTPMSTDINLDGTVNAADLLAVIAGWNATISIADVDNDRVVGVKDLLEVIAAWGESSPSIPPMWLKLYVNENSPASVEAQYGEWNAERSFMLPRFDLDNDGIWDPEEHAIVTQYLADHVPPDTTLPLVIDWEERWDVMMNYSGAYPAGHPLLQLYVQEHVALIQFLRAARPNAQVGVFHFPVHGCYGDLNTHMTFNQERFAPILNAVNAFYPMIYDYPNHLPPVTLPGWNHACVNQAVELSLTMAAGQKTVYAYMWHRFVGDTHQFRTIPNINAPELDEHVSRVFQPEVKGDRADGVVFWGSDQHFLWLAFGTPQDAQWQAVFTAEMTPAELAGGPAGQTQYMERVHTAALQRTSNALRAAEAAIVNPP